MEPRRLTFDIPDAGQGGGTHRLVCHEWGDANAKRTALCVHGLTRNGRDFDFVAQALANGFRVLCPDMPGRGQSEWLKDPAGYSYPAHLADLLFLVQAANLQQVYWVGTSMGGILGMMMANARPGLIRALVLNDIGTIVAAEGIKRISSFADENISFASRAEAEAAMRTRWSTFGIREENQWRHMASYGLMEKDGRVQFAYDPAIMAAYSKTRQNAAEVVDLDLWNLWSAVENIPVLLIRGVESDLLTHETALAMQSRHPNLTLHEVQNAGHAPSLMDAQEIKLIQDWLHNFSPLP